MQNDIPVIMKKLSSCKKSGVSLAFRASMYIHVSKYFCLKCSIIATNVHVWQKKKIIIIIKWVALGIVGKDPCFI